MRTRNHLASFLFSLLAASTLYANPQDPISTPLKPVPYKFDPIKLAAAADSFHFLRSFVDHFYLSFVANQSRLKTVTRSATILGWCVGDAHPENFGFLLQANGSPLFTMNDMDDSGPCPVALDLYRLLVSSRLYDARTEIGPLLEAYSQGLKHDPNRPNPNLPASLQKMMAKSKNQGQLPSSKKVFNGKFIRDDQMTNPSATDRARILQSLSNLKTLLPPDSQVLDMVMTKKAGGGSGGLLRYEVLVSNKNTLLHLELKEEPVPAIYPVSKPIASHTLTTQQRITTTIDVIQGSEASRFYQTLVINGKDFLLRPRFDGNVGLELRKQTPLENQEVIRFEAYTLGMIHSRSIKSPSELSRLIESSTAHDWEGDVNSMTNLYENLFNNLKSH